MAKAKTQATNGNGSPPPDWKDVEERVAGYWTEETPCVGKVVGARTFENSRKRETTLFMIRLLKPCVAKVKLTSGDFDETTLEPGEIIGVFESAGLVALRNLADARVWIQREGTRATKNGEMKTYRIKSPDAKAPVKVDVFRPRGQEQDDGVDSIDESPF